MPLRLSYSQLYLSGLEMKDDLLYTLKSIILTDTALILYNPISKPQIIPLLLMLMRNIFIFIQLIGLFICREGKLVWVSQISPLFP